MSNLINQYVQRYFNIVSERPLLSNIFGIEKITVCPSKPIITSSPIQQPIIPKPIIIQPVTPKPITIQPVTQPITSSTCISCSNQKPIQPISKPITPITTHPVSTISGPIKLSLISPSSGLKKI
jgi:hypothetical protein